MKFIMETMKNCKVELTAEEKTLADVKIWSGIFQVDALSSLLFVIAMMPWTHLHRKCVGGNSFINLQEKINHQMYINNIELFAKKTKKLET